MMKRAAIAEVSVLCLLVLLDAMLVSNAMGLAQQESDKTKPWLSSCSLDDWYLLVAVRGFIQVSPWFARFCLSDAG